MVGTSMPEAWRAGKSSLAICATSAPLTRPAILACSAAPMKQLFETGDDIRLRTRLRSRTLAGLMHPSPVLRLIHADTFGVAIADLAKRNMCDVHCRVIQHDLRVDPLPAAGSH